MMLFLFILCFMLIRAAKYNKCVCVSNLVTVCYVHGGRSMYRECKNAVDSGRLTLL